MACPNASSAERVLQRKPIRRIRSRCCARAASGHVAATPPSKVMKLRRRIALSSFVAMHFSALNITHQTSKLRQVKEGLTDQFAAQKSKAELDEMGSAATTQYPQLSAAMSAIHRLRRNFRHRS